MGPHKGAAKLLETKLGRKFLYLPCRHHIFKIVLGGVFDELMPSTTGPETLLFKRFKTHWEEIEQCGYKTGVEIQSVAAIIRDRVDDLEIFINKVLIPKEKVKFYKPRSVSRARWMTKAIYCLKIFAFQDQFSLTAREKTAITETCLFIVSVYLEAWFTAPIAANCPRNDLNFIKKLHSYEVVNSKIATIALKKMSNHM